MVEGFKQGDIVSIEFEPTTGHEQKGYRPAIIVSNNVMNTHNRLVIACPITNAIKEHPFHIHLDNRCKTTGDILCDQIRAFDLTARNAKVIDKAPLDIVLECVKLIKEFF